MRIARVVLAVVAACSSSKSADPPPASAQTFAEGMQLVCNAPPSNRDALSAYLRTHITNPEVISLIASLGNLDAAGQTERMKAAMTRAGLAPCPVVDAAD